jgi:hypothetical protein
MRLLATDLVASDATLALLTSFEHDMAVDLPRRRSRNSGLDD